MSPLIRELLVNGLVAGTAMKTAKKTSAGAAYFVPAGCLAVIGVVFLCIAGYSQLLEYMTVPMALAASAFVIFAVSGLIGLVGYSRVYAKKPVRKPHDGKFIDTVEHTVKSFMDGMEDPVKDNPKMAVLLAALAGFAAGDQINDRMNTH